VTNALRLTRKKERRYSDRFLFFVDYFRIGVQIKKIFGRLTSSCCRFSSKMGLSIGKKRDAWADKKVVIFKMI
jgi:hypothetical protein